MTAKPTSQLPENYQQIDTLDLTEDTNVAILINIGSLGLFIGFGALIVLFLRLVRPAFSLAEELSNFLTGDFGVTFLWLLVFLGINLVMIFLHEAVHGLFFWIFTQSRPKFGFRGFYAFASAKDWYIPKKPYTVVGLAPLVILTVVGVIALLFVPSPWILPVLLFITLNFAGAVGDMYTVYWLLKKPEDILVQDFGDRMQVYGPEGSHDEAA